MKIKNCIEGCFLKEPVFNSITNSNQECFSGENTNMTKKELEVQECLENHETNISKHKMESTDRTGDSIILTTMCAIVNNSNQWLFINRRKSWKGLAFPGGRVEGAESILQCAKREILEETGLIANELSYKGIAHFYNSITFQRYLVFNFLCTSFSGVQKESCEEGDLIWIDYADFQNHQFAEGMEQRFNLFTNDYPVEMFVEWNQCDGYTNIVKNILIDRK